MRKALLFASFILTSGDVTAFDLDSLFRHSVGGENSVEIIRNIHTFKTTGEITLNGKQGEFISYVVPPNRLYTEFKFDDFSIAQGYDGTTAWQRDMNGRVSKIFGPEKMEMLKSLYIGSYAHLFSNDSSSTVSYSGEVEIGGEMFHAITIYPHGLDTIMAFFEIRSGLMRSVASRMDQMNTIQTFDDFRNTNGFWIPFVNRVTIENVPFAAVLRTETVEIDKPIDISIFSMPQNSDTDFRFPDGVAEVAIPFQYTNSHIELPITINGTKTVRVILDSGASSNIFHERALEDLNLAPIGKLSAMGMGGFEEVDLIRTDSLTIGQLTLYNQVAGSMSLDALRATMGSGVEFGGLLGYDFLSRFPMLIDYHNQTLTIYEPQTFVPPKGGVEAEFFLTMQIPTVHGEIQGIGGDFLVDLGNSLGLVIHEKFARENKIEEKLQGVQSKSGQIGGIGGAVGGSFGLAESFSIGDAVFTEAIVVLADSGQGVVGSLKLAGNVGNPLLESFRVLLDYNNSRIIFYPVE